MDRDVQALIARLLAHRALPRDDLLAQRALTDEAFRQELDARAGVPAAVSRRAGRCTYRASPIAGARGGSGTRSRSSRVMLTTSPLRSFSRACCAAAGCNWRKDGKSATGSHYQLPAPGRMQEEWRELDSSR
ncbi:MAG: hypothetical protein ACREBC_25560 [Pyrinomonadaceae bacterium]